MILGKDELRYLSLYHWRLVEEEEVLFRDEGEATE